MNVTEAIFARRAVRAVILDVTGMKLADAGVAETFGATAAALRLVGGKTIVTGMSPTIAQMLVERGADLGAMRTMSTLRAAVAHALRGEALGPRPAAALGRR